MNWRSHDPFDLLLTRHGDPLRRHSPLAARVLVALGRRTGARTRRRLGVAAHEEPKAIADLLTACSVLGAEPGIEWATPRLAELAGRLERHGVRGAHGIGWGLSFPYASRFTSAPAGTPNAYTTVSVVAALTRAARAQSSERLLALAAEGARMILDDLGLVDGPTSRWFRYWPGEDGCIVNLQALIAAGLQELGSATGDPRLTDAARLGAANALELQRPDGSIPYAADSRGRFVDAFHTGFVLEGLARFADAGGTVESGDVRGCVARGMDYLRRELIAASGLPRSGPGGREVQDGQNIGQLVQTLVLAGGPADREAAVTVWQSHAVALAARALSPRSGAGVSLRWDLGPLVLAGAHLSHALRDGA